MPPMERKNKLPPCQNINAIRTVAVTFGFFCGLTGMIAGYFEILQGNIAPGSIIISIVGPSYSMWTTYSILDLMETYSAVTIIPNFFITGMVAIMVSFLVIVWSVGFLHKKHGAIIFLLLSIIQLLVGGGFVIDLAIITCIVANRINKPLTWWRAHLSIKMQGVLVRLWPWSLIAFVMLFIIMLGMTLLGANNENMSHLLTIAAAVMFLPLILIIIGGFAFEIRRQTKSEQVPTN